jgi:hypothetical protein
MAYSLLLSVQVQSLLLVFLDLIYNYHVQPILFAENSTENATTDITENLILPRIAGSARVNVIYSDTIFTV